MPKSKINDYIFYKITCLDDSCDLCYVGSTANWKERQRKHKFNCTNEKSKEYNYKIYKTIRDNGDWSNFKMIEIGTADQLTKRQAEQIEEYYREDLKANMNGQRCYRTEEQKREYEKEYNKQYREQNKDYYKEYNKQYNEANKETINQRRKGYWEQYYQYNKDTIKEQVSEVIVCECGCQVRRDSLWKHKKSPKHINLMCSIKNISVVT